MGTRRFEMLHIDVVKAPARQLAQVLIHAAEHIQTGVSSIRETKLVSVQAGHIKKLEEEADAIYHAAVGDLKAANARVMSAKAPSPWRVSRKRKSFRPR